MKIYVSEKDMPKSCDKCLVKWDKCNGSKFGADGCPLQSLEQHDNEVRREFAEKLKADIEKAEEQYDAQYFERIKQGIMQRAIEGDKK